MTTAIAQPDGWPLPGLRQELTLSEGAPSPEGAPTWMLHDPAANRFFQLGWPAFELLSRWPLDDAAAVVAAVNRETTLIVTLDDLEALVRTLRQQNLLQAADADDTRRLQAHAAAGRLGVGMWLLKHYLMIRIPLWRPMPFLRRFAGWAEPAFRPGFWIAFAGIAVIGLLLASRQWDEFVHTFHGYADLRGLLLIALALGCAKILHELGHAFTAHRYGCRVPTMGVAFLVMLPVLFTDTTDAWKIPDRRKRLAIGAAGMLAELALAALATLAWTLLPDGPLRAGAFLLATTTWIGTLAINASPFMRFDGYFLLSDWLNMPNLHDRAFAFGRWRMREWLFGFGDAQPEPCTPRRRRFLVGFAFATWLYRFTVFMSIAMVVYHAFFKALGIALFCVEFGWFIVRPVTRECSACWQRRGALRWRRQTVRSALLGLVVLGFFVIPWQTGVSAPALYGPQQAQGLYAPVGASLAASPVPARSGQRVHAGDVLAMLVSPDLEYQRRKAQIQADTLSWEVEQQAFDDRLRQQGSALKRQRDAARETVAGLSDQIAQLTLRAPFDGVVEEADDGLTGGAWLPRGAHLFDVIGTGQSPGERVKGEAFVDEDELARIAPGDPATLVGSVPEMRSLQCRIDSVDRVNLAALDEPAMSSTYGGPIPAELKPGTHLLVPLRATYRVRIGHCADGAAPTRQIAGTAGLGNARSALAWRGLRALLSTVEREAGA